MSLALSFPLRYGVCEAYAGDVAPCNSVFRKGVDYIYIPYTRTSGNQRHLSRLINDTSIVFDLLPMQCRDVAVKVLCTFYFIPCGTSTAFEPPVSVCSEECFHLRNNLCPIQWEQALSYFAGRPNLVEVGLNLIDCNSSGEILTPLSHCCVDAGVTLCKCSVDYVYTHWITFHSAINGLWANTAVQWLTCMANATHVQIPPPVPVLAESHCRTGLNL